jgi:hypothetical protein
MSNKQQLLLILCAALVVVSCKSKKGLTPKSDTKAAAPAKPDARVILLNQADLNQNTFTYYSATGDVEYSEGKTNQELGFSIVMEKDRYVLMNVTAIMGIAVARVLATPDSLVILDMLHRKAIITNYQYLKKYAGVELKLQQLQNLFVGNALFTHDTQIARVDTVNGHILISQQLIEGIIQSTQYSPLLKVDQSILYQTAKNQQFDITYRDLHQEDNNLFPSTIDIHIKTDKKIEAGFRLKNFVFEKKKELQFSIPKSYEIVRL